MDESNEPARTEHAGYLAPTPKGRKRPGAGLWALWVLGFAVGGYVALQLGGVNRVRVGGVAEWALAGVVLGLGQWLALALGRYGSKIPWWAWIPATGLGMATGAAVAKAWIDAMPAGLDVPGAPVVNQGIAWGIGMAGVGFAQWLVLMRGVRQAGWWVLANVAAGAVLPPIITLTRIQVGNTLYKILGGNVVDAPQFGDSGIVQAQAIAGPTGQVVGLVVAGAATGFALVWLLRRSMPEPSHEPGVSPAVAVAHAPAVTEGAQSGSLPAGSSLSSADQGSASDGLPGSADQADALDGLPGSPTYDGSATSNNSDQVKEPGVLTAEDTA